MLYTTWKVGEEEYKLRLTSKNTIVLEEKLGKHPLEVIMGIQDQALPKTSDIVFIIYYSLRAYHPTIKLDAVYDLYDEFVSEGNSITNIIQVLVDIFKTAGFIPEEMEVDTEGKNV